MHCPNEVPDEWLELYPSQPPPENVTRRVCSNYTGWSKCRTVLGMASALDTAVGDVMAAVASAGVAADTVTIFSSE